MLEQVSVFQAPVYVLSHWVPLLSLVHPLLDALVRRQEVLVRQEVMLMVEPLLF